MEKNGQHLSGNMEKQKLKSLITDSIRPVFRNSMCSLFLLPLSLHFFFTAGCMNASQKHSQRNPLNAEEHNNLGAVYLTEQKYDLAEREFLRAVSLKKDFPEALYNLGNLYYAIHKINRAEIFYRRALLLDENFPQLLNNLAWLLMEKGELEEAKTLAQKAVKTGENPAFLNTLKNIENRISEKNQRLEN